MITLAQKLWFRWSCCVLGVINTDFDSVSLTHSHFNKVLEPKASHDTSASEATSLRKPLVLLPELIFQLFRAIFKCITELLNYISLYFNGNVHMNGQWKRPRQKSRLFSGLFYLRKFISMCKYPLCLSAKKTTKFGVGINIDRCRRYFILRVVRVCHLIQLFTFIAITHLHHKTSNISQVLH